MVVKYKRRVYINKLVLYIKQPKYIISSKYIVGRVIIKNKYYLNAINLS